MHEKIIFPAGHWVRCSGNRTIRRFQAGSRKEIGLGENFVFYIL
jgi:hypothetical protein